MPPAQPGSLSLLFLIYSFLSSLTYAQAAPSVLNARDEKLPDTVPGSPVSVSALFDTSYLPAQIGGIVGAYAVSLVLVAVILLALSKKRRSHLVAGNDEVDFDEKRKSALVSPRFPREISSQFPSELQTEFPPEVPPQAYEPRSASPSVPNFSYPSPIRTDFGSTGPNPYIFPSPVSSIGAPGVSPQVDQRVVAADRVMAQQQLEEMYKYVMEHDEAKQKGIVLDAPVLPGSQRVPTLERPAATLTKKERSKPANLNLNATREDKTQSRTSSILSALRSPKKSSIRGVNISSPIMTPKSATFSQHESQEMNTIPPRHYAPPPPPPIPTDQIRFGAKVRTSGAPLTPDMSPESSQSIDERIGYQLGPYSYSHSRNLSQAPTEADPESATSEHSQAPLVGLPLSPKPRFSTLPASPKPGATFQRPNPPSAVRTGGTLPLRAYEPAMNSPSAIAHTTKQTVFERKGPLSPSGNMTPYTAGAAPYSPYQPFTPCVPITPSLVTRDDRRRMKRMMPKTPTLEMVRSSEDIW
ncbi:hypothetical protein HJFPF1_08936 [Paramyrothecium foliicola]|nr:hypothetical protein HJFPF1_08936 [Paramyrothecium foliicola]